MKRRRITTIGFLSLLAVSLGVLSMLAVGCKEKKEETSTTGPDTSQPEVEDVVVDVVDDGVAAAVAAAAAAGEFVNTFCPIMNNPIDQTNVPADLTRMHRGEKVGLCCLMCGPTWDALTDEQKDVKLAEAQSQ